MNSTIDCAQDFIPDIDCEKKDPNTGELIPYAGITGVVLVISADRASGTPIHATLEKAASERSSKPGRISATFDVLDLQAHLLPNYRKKVVYLNVFKSGELLYEPFALRVAADRIGL